MDMFHQGESSDDPLIGILIEELPICVDSSVTYEDLVKHLIMDEKTFIRELYMIMKVRNLWIIMIENFITNLKYFTCSFVIAVYCTWFIYI